MKKIAVAIAGFALLLSAVPVLATHSPLVARYHFNKDAKDSSSYGNDGDITGTTVVKGKYGNALEFAGGTDSVKAPRDGMLKEQGTFELWVMPLDLDVTPQAFIDVDTSAPPPHNYQIQYWTDGKLYFRVNKAGQEVSVNAAAEGFTENEWHHLVMTWNGDGVWAFIDGSEVGHYDGSMTFDNNLEGNLYIGSWFDGTRNDVAVIDEARVWSCALTAEEIAQHFESNSSAAPSCQRE